MLTKIIFTKNNKVIIPRDTRQMHNYHKHQRDNLEITDVNEMFNEVRLDIVSRLRLIRLDNLHFHVMVK